MPIFDYSCQACGHSFDILQKLGADVLTQCPECGEHELRKQLSAPAFHLKGKGWRKSDDTPKKPNVRPKFSHTLDSPVAHAEHTHDGPDKPGGHSHKSDDGHGHSHDNSHGHSHEKSGGGIGGLVRDHVKSHDHHKGHDKDHGHSHSHGGSNDRSHDHGTSSGSKHKHDH